MGDETVGIWPYLVRDWTDAIFCRADASAFIEDPLRWWTREPALARESLAYCRRVFDHAEQFVSDYGWEFATAGFTFLVKQTASLISMEELPEDDRVAGVVALRALFTAVPAVASLSEFDDFRLRRDEPAMASVCLALLDLMGWLLLHGSQGWAQTHALGCLGSWWCGFADEVELRVSAYLQAAERRPPTNQQATQNLQLARLILAGKYNDW